MYSSSAIVGKTITVIDSLAVKFDLATHSWKIMGSQVQSECEPAKRSPLLNVIAEVLCMVFDLVKVLSISIPLLILSVVKILVPSKLKNVRGQTVLVIEMPIPCEQIFVVVYAV